LRIRLHENAVNLFLFFQSLCYIDQVEPCFYLDHEGGFTIFSGKQGGDCDLFDSSGKAQKMWVLEAIRPGNNKLNITLSWKYSNETHQILPTLCRIME